jgi:hypothetical protein
MRVLTGTVKYSILYLAGERRGRELDKYKWLAGCAELSEMK